MYARVAFTHLESVLGADGRWSGVWSRYKIGASSPGRDRIERIEAILPGTARYYFSPLWWLIAGDDFTKRELDGFANWLDPMFRDRIVPFEEPRFGARWKVHQPSSDLFAMAHYATGELKLTLDAVTSILLCLREAECSQDSKAYLRAAKAWATLDTLHNDNFALRILRPFIPFVLQPLRTRKFFPEKIHELWIAQVRASNWGRSADPAECNLLQCLLQLQI